ncbi:MAG: efflux RND transporter periplasmic adaptor subunit [Ignavibacteriales bacterium]
MSNLETNEMELKELDLMPPGAKKSKWTKVVGILVVLVLVVGGYFGYQYLQPVEASYLTQSVTKANLVNSVEATGTVVPLREADLNFKSDTVLRSINVEAGDVVTEGQILALQDDVDFRSAVDKAQSSYQQAKYKQEQSKMSLEKTQRTYAQQTAIYNSGALSQSDLETSKDDLRNSEINLELAKAQVKEAKANLESAQENLDNAKLKAPFDGLITVVNGVVGTSTSTGSSFAHVISQNLKIEAMVNEADIGSVKVGQAVEFTVTTYPNKTFKGTVQRITQQASTTSSVQQYEVDITVDNSEKLLLSGMSVTANIIVAKRSDAVLVPMLALTYAQTYIQENPSAMSGSGMQGRPTQVSANNTTTGNTNNSTDTAKQRAAWSKNSTNGTANQRGNWSKNSNAGTASSASKSAAGSNIQRKFVVVMENEKPMVKTITIGIDDSQNAEVLNGLSGGEKVLIGKYTESSSSSSSSSNSNSNSNSNSQNRSGTGQMMRGVGGGMGGPPM